MSFRNSPVALAAVLGLFCLAAAPAASARDSEPVSVKIKYADLNLASDAGARAMLQRIRHAASSACSVADDDPVYGPPQYFACVRKSTDDAVARLGAPHVTALNGATPTTTVAANTRP